MSMSLSLVRNQRDPRPLASPGSREQLTAPGTGSAPEEVSGGIHLYKAAARVSILTHEEMNELPPSALCVCRNRA